jgi:hypothetical protein
VVERLTKRIALVDDDAVADTLTAELKEGVQERKRVEARVAELESYTTALREQQTEVERLRQIWGGWAGCLSSDPEYIPRARQVLKKTLGGVHGHQQAGSALGLRRYQRVRRGAGRRAHDHPRGGRLLHRTPAHADAGRSAPLVRRGLGLPSADAGAWRDVVVARHHGRHHRRG